MLLDLKYVQIGECLVITKKNQDFLKVTDIETQNIGYVLSLVRELIDRGFTQSTISFKELEVLCGTGNQYKFTRFEL